MSYLHGAYGTVQTTGYRSADTGNSAIVYVGTAPVHNLENGYKNVNVPIAVNNMAEAIKYFGYSDDYAKYTLCEAMRVHFELNGVGPLVLINVLDPTKAAHKSAQATTASKTPANGRIVLNEAEGIIVDTLTVTAGSGSEAEEKEKGVDYSVKYDTDKQTLTIAELTAGALGTDALTISYYTINATGVTADDVIGSTDNFGQNKGVYCVKDVYQLTEYVPAYIGAPGFSSIPAVHRAMHAVCENINGHWNAYMYADLPLVDNSTPLTFDTAVTYKNDNGYVYPNETVFFPMAEGIDGRKYHISVLAAANLQKLLVAQDGIPYRTASNTECAIIKKLYLTDTNAGRVFTEDLVTEKLNKNGIASAAFVGGRWAIWGCHSAEYSQDDATDINVAETNMMMLYYISNDFQTRRAADVDKPMTRNDLMSIISEEQMRLDALISMGALTYGRVALNAEAQANSDIMKGDYSFTFDITTTPLARSLTAIVNWTDQGFVTYFETLTI